MSTAVNRQWLLASRPDGMVEEANFRYQEAPVPEPGPGEMLARTLYVSLDPTMRGWMTDRPSYMPPVQIGAVMRAGGVARVVKSNDPAFSEGALVSGLTGWQDYVVSGGGGPLAFRALPAGVSPVAALSIFGATGMTAYFGLLDLGRPRPGETVVVSGAAGATGSVAGQIAKIKGCRVVGIAGTAAKCAWVKDGLGFDACIDYRTENVGRRLHELCPDGIDVYFDNVGGPILDAVLAQIRLRARIVLCGAISSYNATEPPPGPANLSMLIVMRGRMEGFIVTDYMSRFGEAAQELGGWIAAGELQSREEIVDGLEQAPRALRMLFEGGNTGKLLVNVAGESA